MVAAKSKFLNVRVPRDIPSWFDALCLAIESGAIMTPTAPLTHAGASTPGIFRVPGAKKAVEKLQRRINDNNWVDFAAELASHKFVLCVPSPLF